jgi:hypothetical protein
LVLEHSYIAIAIVKGKMLSIAIHLSSTSLSTPNTPDSGDILNADKVNDDIHLANSSGPCLTIDKDIPLASLSTARCGFGITSTNDAIFALGILFRWSRKSNFFSILF